MIDLQLQLVNDVQQIQLDHIEFEFVIFIFEFSLQGSNVKLSL